MSFFVKETVYSVDYKQLINTHTAWGYYFLKVIIVVITAVTTHFKVLSCLYGTFCFAASKFLSCFLSRNIMSWNDVTIIPTLQFLVARICTPPGEEFHFFGTSNHEKEKSTSKFFHYSLLVIRTFCGFYQENKENSVIYTSDKLQTYLFCTRTAVVLRFSVERCYCTGIRWLFSSSAF